jgi:hypothetical protein
MKRKWHLGAIFILSLLMVACKSLAASPAPTPTREVHLIGGGVTPDPNAWIYVALGDSEAWTFPEYYAEYIAQDNGVRVQLYNAWQGSMSTQDLLSRFQVDTTLRTFLSQARVITFEANPSDYLGLYCIDQSTPYDNSTESWALYKADLNAIIDIIFDLRQGQPTVIIAQNMYVPIYELLRTRGDFEQCLQFWETLNSSIAEVAAERGIPVADVFSAFNGPDHTEDPIEKGYISNDGEHVNQAGAIAMADVFRSVGYPELVP